MNIRGLTDHTVYKITVCTSRFIINKTLLLFVRNRPEKTSKTHTPIKFLELKQSYIKAAVVLITVLSILLNKNISWFTGAKPVKFLQHKEMLDKLMKKYMAR